MATEQNVTDVARVVAERDGLRAQNDHLRAALSGLLMFARGNDHVLAIIHEALDWRPEA